MLERHQHGLRPAADAREDRPAQALPRVAPPALPRGVLAALRRRRLSALPARGRLRGGLVVRRRRTDLPGGPAGELARAAAPARCRAGQEARGATQARHPGRAAVPSGSGRPPSRHGWTPLAAAEDSAAGDIRESGVPQDDAARPRGLGPHRCRRGGHAVADARLPSGSQLTPLAGHRLAGGRSTSSRSSSPRPSFPLSPLVADPTKPDHDAHRRVDLLRRRAHRLRRTSTTAGTLASTTARVYEIRCFVRRHRVECPRDGRPLHVPGHLVRADRGATGWPGTSTSRARPTVPSPCRCRTSPSCTPTRSGSAPGQRAGSGSSPRPSPSSPSPRRTPRRPRPAAGAEPRVPDLLVLRSR